MTVAGGWILAPGALALLILGHGCLVERLARVRLEAAVLAGVGLAATIVLGGFLTSFEATARLATPAAAVAATVGLVANRRWLDRRAARASVPVLVVACSAYALYALPSLGTGQASIAGYVKLDDSATWLAVTDRLLEHGRNIDGVAASSYRRTLEAWLASGYPVGSLVPLGLAARVTGTDAAAAYQAVIAVYAAVLAMGLFACARRLAGGPWRAAFAALLAVQASLFYGYAHWGGIKEAASAALLPPLALLAVAAWRGRGFAALGALCVVVGAMLGILGVNGSVWAAPALLAGAAGVFVSSRRHGSERAGSRLLAVGATVALLLGASMPALLALEFAEHTTSGALAESDELGNLVRPLPVLQAGGLWPVGDFRFDPQPRALVVALALACVLSATVAVGVAVDRRCGAIVALVAIAVTGTAAAGVVGSPWVDAKALAILAPVVLLAAAALAGALLGEADPLSRAAGLALGGVLAGGAVWSTLAVADDVYVAPRERLAELRDVAGRVGDAGPLLVLDFDTYADRYFLRRADPEGATDLRVRPVARHDGTLFPERTTAEVDDVRVGDLWVYRTLVRRRSPSASRPPSAFRLVYAGRFWEAWQRSGTAEPPIARLPLGGGVDPTGVPSCADVARLGRTDGVGSLVALPREAPVIVPLTEAGASSSWRVDGGIAPDRDGTAAVTVDAGGRVRLWVGGSVLGRLAVAVDGRPVGAVAHELAHAGQWLRFSTLALAPGKHVVVLRYTRGLRAGTGFSAPVLGPLAMSPARFDGDVEPMRVEPRAYRRLCDGRRYDWVEAVP